MKLVGAFSSEQRLAAAGPHAAEANCTCLQKSREEAKLLEMLRISNKLSTQMKSSSDRRKKHQCAAHVILTIFILACIRYNLPGKNQNKLIELWKQAMQSMKSTYKSIQFLLFYFYTSKINKKMLQHRFPGIVQRQHRSKLDASIKKSQDRCRHTSARAQSYLSARPSLHYSALSFSE